MYKINPGSYSPIGKSLTLPDSLQSEQGLESAIYLSDQFSVSPALSIEGGVRLNVYNYLGAQKVNVYIAQKDHSLELNISDDGKGFDTAKIFNGNGMSSLRKRAKELNGDFKITSCINKGTDVQLKFKIT